MTTQLPDTEAALLAATVNAPGNTAIPKKNQTEYCLSCGEATPQLYCGNCGLKNDDLRRSLLKLISETLGGIFSFDGRMWRTWAALIFKPGKVARAYADGKRTTYSAPIRVYLVVSFLLLLYLGVTQTNLFSVAVHPKTPEQIAANLEKKAALDLSNSESQPEKPINIGNIQDVIDAAQTQDEAALDEAVTKLDNNVSLDDYNFKFLFFQPQSKFKEIMDANSAKAFVDNLNNGKDPTAIGFDGKPFDIKKTMTIFLTNPNKFNQQFNIWLPRAMFFMVPMVMFLGVIYIRGPNALLYDHLIHAIFIHSVFFMSLLIAILLTKVLPGAMVAKTLLILMLIYLPLSLKRMFKRGWFKTIWTTANIGLIYLIMLFFALIGISTYSLVTLAA